MSPAPPGFSYAAAVGIHALAPAVLFAILYVPLLAFFLARSVARPAHVSFMLAFFSLIRVTAFVLRAVLSRDTAAAQHLNTVIAYEIIYNTGFFGLLYSAYTLVTDRVALAKNPPDGPVTRILRHNALFRIALTAAVSIGITGSVQSSLGTSASTIATGNTLRKVAVYIFLVCAILVLLQTCFLARAEFADGPYRGATRRIGSTHGVYILLVIAALLVAREAFFAATSGKIARQDNEAVWYPLAAVTEFIAVVLFAVPGLVPDHER